MLSQLVAQRYEESSVAIASNVEFSRWAEVCGDVTMKTALLDRLTHHVHAFVLTGQSYRLRQRKVRSEATKLKEAEACSDQSILFTTGRIQWSIARSPLTGRALARSWRPGRTILPHSACDPARPDAWVLRPCRDWLSTICGPLFLRDEGAHESASSRGWSLSGPSGTPW